MCIQKNIDFALFTIANDLSAKRRDNPGLFSSEENDFLFLLKMSANRDVSYSQAQSDELIRLHELHPGY